jgi:hypothetical protein
MRKLIQVMDEIKKTGRETKPKARETIKTVRARLAMQRMVMCFMYLEVIPRKPTHP